MSDLSSAMKKSPELAMIVGVLKRLAILLLVGHNASEKAEFLAHVDELHAAVTPEEAAPSEQA